MKHFLTAFALVGGALLVSCAGSLHPTPVAPNETSQATKFVDVYAEVKVNTLHFPRGTYKLHSSDNIGYYYRTPRGVVQNTSSGPMLRDGGIFVSKRDPNKVRGYVILAGGVTHVGNFSKTKHRFHN